MMHKDLQHWLKLLRKQTNKKEIGQLLPNGSDCFFVIRNEQKKKAFESSKALNKKCRRWDLNPHKRIAYKILSLARLPVPTLLHNGELPYSNILPRRNFIVNSFFKENHENLYIKTRCDIINVSMQNGGIL